jgi:hypothetical protein
MATKPKIGASTYKAYLTLTHLSPRSLKAVSSRILKGGLAQCKVCLRFVAMEHCKNPWKNKCGGENIKLYIMFKGEKLPICRQCWSSIAEKEVSW